LRVYSTKYHAKVITRKLRIEVKTSKNIDEGHMRRIKENGDIRTPGDGLPVPSVDSRLN
jgi:hypothetical protein